MHRVSGRTSRTLRYTSSFENHEFIRHLYNLTWPSPRFFPWASSSPRECRVKSFKQGPEVQMELQQSVLETVMRSLFSVWCWQTYTYPRLTNKKILEGSLALCPSISMSLSREMGRQVLQTHGPREAGRRCQWMRQTVLSSNPSTDRTSTFQGKPNTCIFMWNVLICKCWQLNQHFYKTHSRQNKTSL